MSKVRILSLDGGGIRGVISCEILKELERLIEIKKGEPCRLGDFFDFIAGTSTGGILASGLLVPQPERKTRAKYSTKDIQHMYLNQGEKIFENDPIFESDFKIRSFLSLLYNEKFSAKNLESELKKFFGTCKLSELTKPCLITSYDTEARCAKFFNSADVVHPDYDFYIRDVLRATSAAPTYFEPARISRLDKTKYTLIDGGLYANNPALCAYAEVRKFEFIKKNKTVKNPSANDLMIVSIGTGTKLKSYEYKKIKNYGAISWAQPIIDILMSANSETVHYQLKKIYETLSKSDANDYYRLEPLLNLASAEMDDASSENIQNLLSDATIFIDKNKNTLNEIADKILAFE